MDEIQETEEERQIVAANPQLFSVGNGHKKVAIDDEGVHPNLGDTSMLDDSATVPNAASSVADSQATLTETVLTQLKLNAPVEVKRPEFKKYGKEAYVAFKTAYLEYV